MINAHKDLHANRNFLSAQSSLTGQTEIRPLYSPLHFSATMAQAKYRLLSTFLTAWNATDHLKSEINTHHTLLNIVTLWGSDYCSDVCAIKITYDGTIVRLKVPPEQTNVHSNRSLSRLAWNQIHILSDSSVLEIASDQTHLSSDLNLRRHKCARLIKEWF